jgi:hypothetical protein
LNKFKKIIKIINKKGIKISFNNKKVDKIKKLLFRKNKKINE